MGAGEVFLLAGVLLERWLGTRINAAWDDGMAWIRREGEQGGIVGRLK